eukprot:scaffold248389_cov16-Prasinocladus_malaysianus.AAC.1
MAFQNNDYHGSNLNNVQAVANLHNDKGVPRSLKTKNPMNQQSFTRTIQSFDDPMVRSSPQ